MSEKHFHIEYGKEFEVKELFKDISTIIKGHFHSDTNNLRILDVGCASGELPVFLKRDLQTKGEVYGLDLSEDLIHCAQERFGHEGIEFFVGNAVDFKLGKKVDVMTMTSVLSHFDDPYPVISHLIKHLNGEGILIISGIFSPWNIEVRTVFKTDAHKEWQTGMNQFGLQNITDYLKEKGYACEITEQIMPFDIPAKDHPSRSWTVSINGKRAMMNRLQFAYNIYILKITRRNDR